MIEGRDLHNLFSEILGYKLLVRKNTYYVIKMYPIFYIDDMYSLRDYLEKENFRIIKNELGIKPAQRIDTKVLKEDFLNYAKDHSKEECMHKFNITERLYYKYKKKYKLNDISEWKEPSLQYV